MNFTLTLTDADSKQRLNFLRSNFVEDSPARPWSLFATTESWNGSEILTSAHSIRVHLGDARRAPYLLCGIPGGILGQ